MIRSTVLLIALTLVMPMMTGCASKYGEQKTVVNYYPGCYGPIRDLRDREYNVAKTTAGSTAFGALGGALIGLLATGKVEGAVVGAAAGGATGLVAGNIYAKKQQQADDNMRLASYLQDLDGDISNLDVTGAAAKTSLQCYNGKFKELIAAIKAKKISREASAQRFAEIMTGMEEANAILGQVISDARNLSAQYEQAFIQEEQNINSPQKAAQGIVAYQAKKQTINRGRQRAQKLVQSEQQWTEEKSKATTTMARHKEEYYTAVNEIESINSDVRNSEI